jgi:hypothetical protein
MKTYDVGFLIGSLATKSINRRLANALFKLAPSQLKFREIEFKDLPLYSYDCDADFPEVAKKFKREIEQSDAILIVTPMGQEFLCSHSFRRHRHLARRDRHRGGSAAPTQRARLSEFAANELS